MVVLLNVLALGITVMLFLLIIYSIIYFLLFITGRFKNKEKFNDKCLKILYVMVMLPFIFAGLHILCLAAIFPFDIINKIIVGIFGLFLLIYPSYKCIRKIKDIDYFGGV